MGFENYSLEDWFTEGLLNSILVHPDQAKATHNKQMLQLIGSNQSIFGKKPWKSKAEPVASIKGIDGDSSRILKGLMCAFIHIQSTIGNRVTFAHPEWATDADERARAAIMLRHDHDYHLKAVLVTTDATWIWLEEFPNMRFNGVMFTEAKE